MQEHEGLPGLNDGQFLDLVGEMGSLFHKVMPIENTVIVTDREKFRHYFKGTEAVIKEADLIGRPVPNSGHIPIALKTGAANVGIIPKEAYGVAFKSSTAPVHNAEGQIIGTLTIGLSLKNQTALQQATENVSASAEQISASTEELASSATHLADNVAEVLGQTNDILQLIEQTNDILDFVNHVASNSRLLGLNAAIEAARAGEMGRGFAVVADEIRRMAENSAKSVNDTKILLANINKKITHLTRKVEELTDVAHTQAAATQEMTAMVQNFTVSAQVMKTISEVI